MKNKYIYMLQSIKNKLLRFPSILTFSGSFQSILFENLWLRYIFLVVSGLFTVVLQAFFSCGAQGASLVVLGRLLLLRNTGSPLHRLSSWGTRAQQLWHVGLVAPQRVGSQFSHQGLNPCPLHWKADSKLLDHQGSPWISSF